MKSVFYNKEKAIEEKKDKVEVDVEFERRANYFKGLVNDKKFRKYILEEILDKEIQTNKDISGSIESMIIATPEEVKAMMIAKNSALITSQKIKNRITINF